MIVSHRNVIGLIAISFAFDSLLKISLGGLNLHIGLLFLVFGLFLLLCSRNLFSDFSSFVKENVYLTAFVIFSLFQFPLAENKLNFIFVYLFLVIPYFLYFYIYTQRDKINYRLLFLSMLLIVLIGGMIQGGFAFLYDHQITLGGISEDYYDKGTSVDHRIRGFFLEPNWFGLFLTFCFIGYLATLRNFSFALLFSLTVLAYMAYMSGNRLSNYFLLLGFMVFLFDFFSKRILFISVILAGSFPILFFLYSLIMLDGSGGLIDDRSLSARTLTAAKVLAFTLVNFDYFDYLIGIGFSNWSEVALENRLTSRAALLASGSALRDTSESYIFFLEGGLIGCALVIMDSVQFVKRAMVSYRRGTLLALVSSLFIISAAFYYPIFFFMPYLIPYFLIRAYYQRPERVYESYSSSD